MKTFIAVFVFASSMIDLGAVETEGLFVMGKDQRHSRPELKNGEFILRHQAVRLPVTRVVFRSDTEDPSQYWLEMDLKNTGAEQNPDPGDFYIFRIDGKDYGGFSTRGQIHPDTWRWALSMTDIAAGRTLLNKIGKAYSLSNAQVRDETQ